MSYNIIKHAKTKVKKFCRLTENYYNQSFIYPLVLPQNTRAQQVGVLHRKFKAHRHKSTDP